MKLFLVGLITEVAIQGIANEESSRGCIAHREWRSRKVGMMRATGV